MYTCMHMAMVVRGPARRAHPPSGIHAGKLARRHAGMQARMHAGMHAACSVPHAKDVTTRTACTVHVQYMYVSAGGRRDG